MIKTVVSAVSDAVKKTSDAVKKTSKQSAVRLIKKPHVFL